MLKWYLNGFLFEFWKKYGILISKKLKNTQKLIKHHWSCIKYLESFYMKIVQKQKNCWISIKMWGHRKAKENIIRRKINLKTQWFQNFLRSTNFNKNRWFAKILQKIFSIKNCLRQILANFTTISLVLQLISEITILLSSSKYHDFDRFLY